jgi:predicted DNA-binding transcriptional regulator YafY
MFTGDEIEALVLGARVVKGWGDPALARAAEDLLAKVEAVLPPSLRDHVADSALFAMNLRRGKDRDGVAAMLTTLRAAVRDTQKVQLAYVDRNDARTARTIWPLGLFYWGLTWTVGAWCELRQGFRSFRLDRITDARIGDRRFPPTPGRTLRDFFEYCRRDAGGPE